MPRLSAIGAAVAFPPVARAKAARTELAMGEVVQRSGAASRLYRGRTADRSPKPLRHFPRVGLPHPTVSFDRIQLRSPTWFRRRPAFVGAASRAARLKSPARLAGPTQGGHRPPGRVR